MSLTVQSGATLPFERFWKWLKHHPNCILRAGTSEAWLYDHEDLHWHLEEGAERRHRKSPPCQWVGALFAPVSY